MTFAESLFSEGSNKSNTPYLVERRRGYLGAGLHEREEKVQGGLTGKSRSYGVLFDGVF